MIVNDKDMLKLENFDLENPTTVSADVEFNSSSAEDIKLSIDLPNPKLKKQIKIQHVELPKYGTSGSTKGLF